MNIILISGAIVAYMIYNSQQNFVEKPFMTLNEITLAGFRQERKEKKENCAHLTYTSDLNGLSIFPHQEKNCGSDKY